MHSAKGSATASTMVTDLAHFDIRDPRMPVRTRRQAEYFGSIVSAATSSTPGQETRSRVGCRRRPKRRPCVGRLVVIRTDVPGFIAWRCSDCDDSGIINNWRGSPWDRR